MNLSLKVFILLSVYINYSNCKIISTLSANFTEIDSEKLLTREKRQIPFTYDFGFLDYAAYDYYDWVCLNGACQVCDVLTGACCSPAVSQNCFLPDSCANNPCLSGGTCVDTLTVQGQPDFVCVCIRGLTGKYCQLVDDFTPQTILPMPIAAPVTAPKKPAYGQQATPQTPYSSSGRGYNNAYAGTSGYGAAGAGAAGLRGGYAGGAAGGYAGGAAGGYAGGAAGGYAGGVAGGYAGGVAGGYGVGAAGGAGLAGLGNRPTPFGGRKKRELEIAETLFKKK